MTAKAQIPGRWPTWPITGPTDRFLLISDRHDRSADLADILTLAGAVTQISPLELSGRTDHYFRMIVDVDLTDIDTVLGLRRQFEAPAAHHAPRYFVIGADRHHGGTQARALGASMTLFRPFAPEDLLGDISADCAASFSVELAQIDDVVCAGVDAAHRVFLKIFEGLKAGQGLSLEDVLEQEEVISNALYKGGLQRWLEVVSLHHNSTYRHCLSVTGFAVAFAQHLGFSSRDQRRLARAALLHDLGKACIPLSILDKPGRLTEPEMAEMQRHCKLGYDLLLQQGGFPSESLDVVLHHHELLDGSGYPDRLSNTQISDVVRMVTIADIYSALIERRSYRAGMDRHEAFLVLESMGGKLDRDLLRAFRGVALGAAT